MIIYTTGSIGDSYINLCKMYKIAQKMRIKCIHYTKHKKLKKKIKEIYSLCPNIKVEFSEKFIKRDINSCFYIADNSILPIKYFPNFSSFNRLRSKFNLPKNYVCLCIRSGRDRQKRQLDEMSINKIIANNNNIVLIGSDIDVGYDGCINLINKTKISEAMAIVAGSQKFYGFQGLFCFVAMSHRISTVAYAKEKNRDERAIKMRCPEPWKKYLNIVRI